MNSRFFIYAILFCGFAFISLGAIEYFCSKIPPAQLKHVNVAPASQAQLLQEEPQCELPGKVDDSIIAEERKLMKDAVLLEKKEPLDIKKAERLAKLKTETMQNIAKERQDERKAEIEKNMRIFSGTIRCADGTLYNNAGIASCDSETISIASPEGLKKIKYSELDESFRKLFDPSYPSSK